MKRISQKRREKRKSIKKQTKIKLKPVQKLKEKLVFSKRKLLMAGGVFLTLIAIGIIVILAGQIVYAAKIYPRVWLGDLNLGRKTKQEATKILEERIIRYNQETEIELEWNDEKWQVSPQDLGADFDIKETIDEAYQVGHSPNFLSNSWDLVKVIFCPQKILAKINFDEEKLAKFFDDLSGKIDKPFKNATLKIENQKVEYISEAFGLELKQAVLEIRLKNKMGGLATGTIELPVILTLPQIEKENTEEAKLQAEQMISASVELVYEKQKFIVTPAKIASWIVFKEKAQGEVLGIQSTNQSKPEADLQYTLLVDLDKDKVGVYLKDITKKIETPAKNAVLAFENGKLIIVTPSQEGRGVDQEKFLTDFTAAAKSTVFRKVTLELTTIIPEVREDNLSSLGIVELISKGESSFSGSPKNRIHNIGVGASKFNGVLVSPGEVFSFNQTLGPVDAGTGFLPELVIKEDKTIPEFGGGLCQVSTTAFRAGLLAGLPIIEREPHAYRVTYYDWPYGPGVDATIYPPHPDVRFKNDTGHYILIQTKVSGSRLIFEFYGTKGGRRVEISKPQILWTKPDGSLGTKFERRIYQNEQLVQTDVFKSNYKSPALYPKPAVETGAPVVQ